MNSSLKNEARRCRPLLGTLVEITASGPSKPSVDAAIESAFAAIVSVQRLMSVHDENSELSAVNRAAHRHPVQVSSPTRAVLVKGLVLAEQSGGAFDFTVGATLARWKLLPQHMRRQKTGDWRDVQLLPDGRVWFQRPLTLDFGGIAKGYAVDVAINALRQAGAASGLVNAGGDLRAFGREPAVVHVRHPAQPWRSAYALAISNRALATSSPCFSRRRWRGRTISHLVALDREKAVTADISVSVLAEECWVADALTKVVLNAPSQAGRLLALHRAEACVLAA
jgi:thiamine biosynthesis lipoprotein